MSIWPAAPDQVAVPLLFRVRKDSTTFEEAGKLIPAFAFVVALVARRAGSPAEDEKPVDAARPVQQEVAKFRIPGAAPAEVPLVKFMVDVDMVCHPGAKIHRRRH